MLNIAVLVSGGGTNLQALIEAVKDGRIDGRITAVISSKDGVFALERAKKAGIPTSVIERRSFKDDADYERAQLEALKASDAELVVLAGFLSILGSRVVDAYAGRILNVHPALIPSFCGKGYYGIRVHEAALQRGVKITGATVHFVNNEIDGGAIVLQKAVEVHHGDTPEILQRRVMEEAEWKILPEAVALFCQGKIMMIDGKSVIRK